MLALVLGTVWAITIVFTVRAHCSGAAPGFVLSGAVSLGSGLVTSVLMAAHLASVILPAMAQRAFGMGWFETGSLIVLGIAILIPGIFQALYAGALTRGELESQKRALVAGVMVLGLTLPLAGFEPLALVMAILSFANIAILLSSRTGLEINEQEA